MQQPAAFFAQQIQDYSEQSRNLRRQLLNVSILRITIFSVAIALLFQSYRTGDSVYSWLAAAAAVVFIILLRMFSGLKTQRLLADKMVAINQWELNAEQRNPHGLYHPYSGLRDSMHAADLDVFGDVSLFSLVNRSATNEGATRLALLLQHPFTSQSAILQQQHAIKTISEQPGNTQLIIARGLAADADIMRVQDIHQWIEQTGTMHQAQWLKIARWVLPAVACSALVYYLYSDILAPLLITAIINWLIIIGFSKYINSQHALIGKKEAALQQYASILRQFTHVEARSSAIISQLNSTAAAGNQAIHQLSKLSSMFDQRLNLLVNILLNSLFLYDVHVSFALENWKHKHRRDFAGWIEAVGEIERLASFGLFAFANPHFQYPSIHDGTPFIRASGLAHPFIPAGESIGNELSIGETEKLQIITGSNMSGKSTFLRTVGLNVLLAQCGSPVCASTFSFSPMKILSSIRIDDSLRDHTSYFMAELKRLQSIIHQLEGGEAALVLIDEVLRGTNSGDKTHGSAELIRKLVTYNAITLFATHDLALSELQTELPGLVSNYCFESSIIDGELTFDYKLHAGVARNRNATFLMKKMGIIAQ
jgi:DNA mismatch repair ATPase MutS